MQCFNQKQERARKPFIKLSQKHEESPLMWPLCCVQLSEKKNNNFTLEEATKPCCYGAEGERTTCWIECINSFNLYEIINLKKEKKVLPRKEKQKAHKTFNIYNKRYKRRETAHKIHRIHERYIVYFWGKKSLLLVTELDENVGKP
ncbi:CLUMA_CG009381, isoform A [Clunio marinus]|uniref:CLUMA_CG009381, isoform A n=1 Tax=Clunio marinus TaxID=568069 RepID=A0A1J1I6Q1_9DIPT|nr:CLUMA_CG009381, isoform A [Clunio marinus]